MRTNKPARSAGASLSGDLHQAGGLLASIFGKALPEKSLVLRLLAAIWLAVERLRHEVQTSAQTDDWQSSEAATIAKGRALGIEARPGESMASYRARIGQGSKS